MSDFNWCHGPQCHEKHTVDRVRGVKGSKVLRTRKVKIYSGNRGWYSFFCSQGCKNEWLNKNMECVRARTVVPFINHRRESQGYHKVTDDNRWGASHSIERVDNRTELD